MRSASSAFVGALGFDTVATIDATHAKNLYLEGMRFAVRYLGSLTSHEVDVLHATGLAVMPVTYGMKHGTILGKNLGANYGATTVRNAMIAGIPPGVTVWLDLEDATGAAVDVIDFVSAWCGPIKTAGYMPGLYVGAGAVLSGPELYSLPVVRYWQSLSRETDARGQIAEPSCGWCMIQLFPTVTLGETSVDIDVVQKDYRGRLPMWCSG